MINDYNTLEREILWHLPKSCLLLIFVRLSLLFLSLTFDDVILWCTHWICFHVTLSLFHSYLSLLSLSPSPLSFSFISRSFHHSSALFILFLPPFLSRINFLAPYILFWWRHTCDNGCHGNGTDKQTTYFYNRRRRYLEDYDWNFPVAFRRS